MAKNGNKSTDKFISKVVSVPVSTYVILALALFAGFGFYWWKAIYTNPQNVFDAMMNNNLRLSGVTRTVTQEDNTQSMKQISRVSLTGEPQVFSETTLEQGQGTTVVTESIGTPTEDFVRYTSIDTDQTNPEGKDLDFESILGVWGSQEQEPSEQTDGEAYNEAVVGIFPFANLSAQQRKEMTDVIAKEEVYKVDYDLIERESKNGRPTYTFDVGIDAVAYIEMLKKFGQMTGMNNLEELDSSSYEGSERLKFKVTVDVRSKQLVAIENSASDRTEEYSAQNAALPVDVPEDAISVEELQTRLQAIQ